ncbi:MAG TPA: dihydroneopterin aldolase, partial [Firmicutes bacterium]|nr:dihydroneopterin aldolase [Bacillota bacterium]
DKLSLKNMIFYGHHGVYPAEKELGQRIEVDVDLWTDFLRAAGTDDLSAAISYVDIYSTVKDTLERESYNLIEAMAVAICERIRDGYDVRKVTVRVRKPQPPVGGLMDSAEVEISRESDRD